MTKNCRFVVLLLAGVMGGCGGDRTIAATVSPGPALTEPPRGPTDGGISVPTTEVRGVVRDSGGEPAAGATVAVISNSEELIAEATTDELGAFELAVPVGEYAITATSDSGWSYLGPVAYGEGPNEPIEVQLHDHGTAVSGRVAIDEGTPPGSVLVRAQRWSMAEGDVYFTRTREDGTFRMSLVRDSPYRLSVDDPLAVSDGHVTDTFGGQSPTTTLRAFDRKDVYSDAPESLVNWLRERSHAIGEVDSQASLPSDLFRERFKHAEVIGLGEGTHGTNEFFVLKHRLLKLLIEHHDVRVVGMEASWSDTLAAHDYVLYGTGAARPAVAKMRFWTVDTEEVVAFVEWLRNFNQQRPLDQRVHLVGIDIQYTSYAFLELESQLETVIGKTATQRLVEPLRAFAQDNPRAAYQAMSKTQQEALGPATSALVALVEKRRRSIQKRFGSLGWRRARQHARVLQQAERYLSASGTTATFGLRDEAMAENVLVAHRLADGKKVAIWAHNGHVMTVPNIGLRTMGMVLSEQLRDRYLPVGFLFNQGRFRAREGPPGPESRGVVEQELPQVASYHWEALLNRVGHVAAIFDLSGEPPADAATWYFTGHPMRHIGSTHEGGDEDWPVRVLPETFDMVVFVERTSAATPTATGRRGPGE